MKCSIKLEQSRKKLQYVAVKTQKISLNEKFMKKINNFHVVFKFIIFSWYFFNDVEKNETLWTRRWKASDMKAKSYILA